MEARVREKVTIALVTRSVEVKIGGVTVFYRALANTQVSGSINMLSNLTGLIYLYPLRCVACACLCDAVPTA